MSDHVELLADLGPEARADLAALALRMRRAEGPLLKVLNRIGGSVEDQLKVLPAPVRDSLTQLSAAVLEQVYYAAARVGGSKLLPKGGPRMQKLAAVASGVAGGAGGLGTAIVELPATLGLIFNAMQRVAEAEGLDPSSEEVRLICLDILGSGGPGQQDDGVNTTFFGARLGLTGTTIQAVISRIAPRVATVIGQKLAGQAVPVIGAVAGAGVNYLFMSYYQEMARIRFALRRLASEHGQAAIDDAFRAEMALLRSAPRRAD